MVVDYVYASVLKQLLKHICLITFLKSILKSQQGSKFWRRCSQAECRIYAFTVISVFHDRFSKHNCINVVRECPGRAYFIT